MEKIKLQKIERNLLDKLRKLYAWNVHLEMFSLPQPIGNPRQFLFLRFNYLRSSQHGLKKYIKLIYSTSFLSALLVINIPVA